MSKQIAAGALCVAGLAACWTNPAAPPPVVTAGGAPAAKVAQVPERFDPNAVVMTDTGVGPLKANVSIPDLAAQMPGYTLVPASDKAFEDFSEGPHVNFMLKGERMFIAVTHGDEVFNIHTDNPHVAVAGHSGWRVGAAFTDSRALSRCECWGGEDVCWKDGEHVALAFARSCSNTVSDPHQLRVLEGLTIKRMVWNPEAFTGGPDPDPDPAAAPGGGLSGNVRAPVQNGGGGGDDDDDGTGDVDGD